LVAAIEKRGGHLVVASEELDGALSEYVFGDEPGIAQELEARFAAVRAEFSTFSEENLHEFRKRIKMVRYLAEIHADADRACAHIALQMKKVQSAIGEWHDWQELGRETLHGRHAKNKSLAELLHTVTTESFEAALSSVNTVSARMQGEDTGLHEVSQPEDRKLPARDDSGSHADLDKKLA